MKKKNVQDSKLGWATAHFPALVAIQQDCIAIGRTWARMARRAAEQVCWGMQQRARHGFVWRPGGGGGVACLLDTMPRNLCLGCAHYAHDLVLRQCTF